MEIAVETLEEAKAVVKGEKPHRLYHKIRGEAAFRHDGSDARRRLIFIAARALTLLELDDAALHDALSQ